MCLGLFYEGSDGFVAAVGSFVEEVSDFVGFGFVFDGTEIVSCGRR